MRFAGNSRARPFVLTVVCTIGVSALPAEVRAQKPEVEARAQSALVAFLDAASGELGVRVSREGLVWTTRAAVAACLTEADRAGFIARSFEDERPCAVGAYNVVGDGARVGEVRLVFAPEAALAELGGPDAAFDFPRTRVETVLVRLWEAGQPARTTRFLPLSARGPVDGDRVSTPGQQPARALLATPERVIAERDALAFELERWLALRDVLDKPAPSSAQRRALRFEVGRRAAAVEGRLGLLRDAVRVAESKRRHDALVVALHDLPASALDGAGKDEATRALTRIDAGWNKAAPLLARLLAFGRLGPTGALWDLAAADGTASDDVERTNAAFDLALETERIAWGLESLRLALPARDSFVEQVLRGKSARARAEEAVRASALADPSRRKAVLDAMRARRADPNAAPIDDALVALRAAVDVRRRDIEAQAERELFAELADAEGKLAAAERALEGARKVPAAGAVVRGTAIGGKHVHWAVTFGDAFAADRRARGAADRSLPERWRNALTRVDFSIPLVLQAELGASPPRAGGPLVSDDGLAIAVIVGSNRAALADDLLAPRGDSRAVAITSNGLLHALDRVYDAKHLVDELLSSAADR